MQEKRSCVHSGVPRLIITLQHISAQQHVAEMCWRTNCGSKRPNQMKSLKFEAWALMVLVANSGQSFQFSVELQELNKAAEIPGGAGGELCAVHQHFVLALTLQGWYPFAASSAFFQSHEKVFLFFFPTFHRHYLEQTNPSAGWNMPI